jgi:septal ring factor EnvC (AmiA/AmiB activator)
MHPWHRLFSGSDVRRSLVRLSEFIMTTTIAKVLAVAVCVLSLGFMGFAIAVFAGGKNWNTELAAPDLAAKYQLTNSGGETPTWSTTRLSGAGGSVGGAVAGLPQALTAARKDLQSAQQAEITRLNPAIADAQKELENVKKLNATDIVAMQSRIDELDTQAAASEKNIAELSNRLTQLMDSAANTRKEAARRREDVARLRNQIELLRTDIYRLVKLKRTLTDRVVRLKINNDSLRQRKQQLSSQ